MQSKTFFLLFVALALSIKVFSQQQINIASGLSVDINNKNSGKFLYVPVVLQYLPSSSRWGSFIVNINVQIPVLNGSGYDSAFSINATPHAIRLKKSIESFNFAISVGYRFIIPPREKQHLFIDVLPVGICQQEFTVKYKNYNSSQYDILNPDVGLNKAGLIMSLGVGYAYKNFLGEFFLQSPIISLENRGYPLSYRFASPMQITVGYSFKFQKHKK